MKQEEKSFEHENEDLYHTDDEESQTELSAAESSLPSTPLTRNESHENDLNSQWPRSYRKSMDMLTGVTPPSSTNLVSSLYKRRQSSFLSSFTNSPRKEPFLHKDETQFSINSFLASNLKLSVPNLSILDENRRCSFSQSLLNGINVLCGVGLLTMPYAVKEGGWLGLFVLFSFGVITFYTAILLKRCSESSPGLHTYPDIGQAAFGTTGRILVSILLFLELYASCVEYIIMMSDNLSMIFPNTSVHINGVISLDSNQVFAITTTLLVLPTVWLRDLSLLAYLSAGGVFSSILLAICLFWVGTVNGVGFHPSGQPLDLTNLPVAIGIYGFGFEGHSVFPNIYSSMKDPSKFPLVLLISFVFCIIFYIGVAVCGYTMFGDEIQSQFTLNMPQNFTSSKIAIWTAVVTPVTKYAITITPVALCLEELMESSPYINIKSKSVSMFFRTILVLSTLLIALTLPFFATVAALIGSFVAMLVAFIFPCLCYLSILKGKISNIQIGTCVFIVSVGVISGSCGTYSTIARLINELN